MNSSTYITPSTEGPLIPIGVLVISCVLTVGSIFTPFFVIAIAADVLALMVTAATSIEYAWKGRKPVARVTYGVLGAIAGAISLLIIGAVIVTFIRNSSPSVATHGETLATVQSRISACDVEAIGGAAYGIQITYKPHFVDGQFVADTNDVYTLDSSNFTAAHENIAAIRENIDASMAVCGPVRDTYTQDMPLG